jgi:hypothetical protein
MSQRKQKTVRLHPLATNALLELKMALEVDEGHKATQEDIVAALIVGATTPQLSGMLTAFHRQSARLPIGSSVDHSSRGDHS